MEVLIPRQKGKVPCCQVQKHYLILKNKLLCACAFGPSCYHILN
jgi:hypothetical protein